MYLRLLTVMHTSFCGRVLFFFFFFKQGHVENCLLYVLFSSVIYIFIFYFGRLGVGLGHCFCIFITLAGWGWGWGTVFVYYMSCSTSGQE